MGVVEYNLECGDEIHTVGVDDNGDFVLSGCNLEEEETSVLMGCEPSQCYELVSMLSKNAYAGMNKALNMEDPDLLALSIAAGTNIDAGHGYALRRSVDEDMVPMVKVLLDAGASLYTGAQDILTAAVNKGNAAIVAMLLDAGADVDESFKPLVNAVDRGRFDIMILLLSHGVDPNAQYGYPLAAAVRKRNKEAVVLLVEYGADPTVDDDRAFSMLRYYPDSEIEQILREACR